MSSRKELFVNYKNLKNPTNVTMSNGMELKVIGKGDIELEAFDGQCWSVIILKDVLSIPDMPFNLFSVGSVLDKGYIQSANSEVSIFKDSSGIIVATAVRESKVWRIEFRVPSANDMCFMKMSLKRWHERLAHQNVRYIRNTLKRNKIKYGDNWDDYVCEGCIYGKHHRVSHRLNPKVSENRLDLIHVDLCEMDVYSLGGAKYFLLFKDDYTHYRNIYFLKNKSDAPEKLDVYLKLVENQVKRPRSDHGTEIKNGSTKELLEQLGVFHTKSSIHTPRQNGRVERENRTVVETARTVIYAKGLDERL